MTYPSEQQAAPFIGGASIQHMYNHKTGELTTEGETLIAQALDLIQAACWTNAEAHGFHEEGGARNFGQITALLHSEISEAFESWRANEPPLWFNDKKGGGYHPDPYNEDGSIRKAEGVFAEFADEIIRLGDNAEELQRNGVHASLAESFIFKFRYNLSRPFKHGKIA
ncbi:MazG-like nucleotide pyrophosphohydrolase [Gordonia phage Harambe]|uniref:MazG-like nucleotide pyrophosphohydrolase n=3 Tax=Woesvirus woes TaxID=1982751 RepID=A0A514A600_9CAUD|nr:MazG-like nucleotide pyrophosphohydrolase [Gordonia phage Harambe]QDF16908.1 MazG-like nucleotide pyrophosphohydrolase [Gordonia phage Teal]QDH48694.1 MazG-like nucleotide pyrophosphohydrolase [Gordonia phage Newt]UVF60821.1 MazG-like nucleotide pyrophosphohydrolase [Gordonia phage Sticker17]WAA19583.1 MazG-like nucleotide pyrophosphohydrolase [Gordonia phage GalacticEye]